MSLSSKLFSFRGRLRRRDWWLLTVALFATELLLTWLALWAVLGERITEATADASPAADAVQRLIPLAFLWPIIAVSVKRAHDRDASGRAAAGVWIVLTALAQLTPSGQPALSLAAFAIQAVALLWILLNLGLYDGSSDENRHGPSPKAARPQVAAA